MMIKQKPCLSTDKHGARPHNPLAALAARLQECKCHSMNRIAAAVGLIMLPLSQAMAASVMPVTDLAIVLAIDGSYSVDDREHAQQIMGTASAFASKDVRDAIDALPHRRIAITLIQWSDQDSQVTSLPWSVIEGGTGALQLADRIAGIERETRDGGTAISAAVSYALLALERCPCITDRRIIDLSGDGRQNAGPPLDLVRQRAAGLGVTINGLAIANEVSTLDYYFERRLITGSGAFVEKARDYGDYARAIKRKLLRELSAGTVMNAPRPGDPATAPRRS